MNRFYIIVGFLAVTLLLAGCAGSSTAQKSEDDPTTIQGPVSITVPPVPAKSDTERRAMDHFLNGVALEAKGEYAAAVLEFRDALALDPSAGIHYVLGKNYFLLNKLNHAADHSRKAVHLDSSNVEYLNLMQKIYTTARQFDSAAVVLEKMIALDSTRVDAYYQLARIYEDDKPAQAIGIYEKLSSIIGNDWNVLIRVAELYERIGKPEKATETIETLLEIDPANTAVQKLLVEFYMRNNQYERAIERTDEILQLYPEDVEAREAKAEIYLQMEEWQKAAKEYEVLLANPDIKLETKLQVGASYFSASFEDSTLLPISKNLFKAIEQDTSHWQVMMYLGAISYREGNDSLAVDYFDNVTESAPWNVDAWVRLGGLYFDNGEYDNAIKVMNQAIERFPREFVINLILGLSWSNLDNDEKAEEYLLKCVELRGDDITALSAYGYTLHQLGRDDEAVMYLDRALILDPENVDLMGTVGLIYDDTGQHEKSDSVYAAALAIDPDNPLVNNNFAYALAKRGQQLELALEMVNRALEMDSENASYLDTKGWVYYMMGEYEQAREFIEAALETGSASAEVLEHLGDVYYQLGLSELAMEKWEKAFDLDKGNKKLQEKIQKGTI